MAFRWDSGSVSIGADSGAWRRALQSLHDARNFVRREVVDDDDVIALERCTTPQEV
jgi:hypothetical protein